MIKSVIFDLDGTIGNTLSLCILAFKKAIEPLASRTLNKKTRRHLFYTEAALFVPSPAWQRSLPTVLETSLMSL